MEGLRRGHRRRLARDHLPRHLQRPGAEVGDRRVGEDAAGTQPRTRAPEASRAEEVNDARAAEVLELTGALAFETLPAVLEQSAQYAARADLPDRLTIDFSAITEVDSSAVAL